jgi:muramoyltetrapeptide carboxypeptidase
MGDALLVRGDVVGVVAPGFAVAVRPLREGVWKLEKMGFRVALGEHVLDRDDYFAGSDDDRARDLNKMLADPEVRAVWFARGGYGSARLLERIRWRLLVKDPKPLIGYSDVTAIHAVANRRSSAPCLYGPVVTELGDASAYHAASLRDLLAGRGITIKFGRRQVLRAGLATGRLRGGNLTVLTHLAGTRFAPDLRGSILFIEDVGEPVYRLDRTLQHLRMSGALRGVAGVVVGSFKPAARRGRLADRSVIDLLRETFLPLEVPVVVDLAAGHRPSKRTLPIGGRARLDTARGTLVLEPCFDDGRAGDR